MALEGSQFDPSLLPDSAQEFNLSADGKINAEGDLKGQLGPKQFRIENGIIVILDRGSRRAPQTHESEQVLNVLRARIKRKDESTVSLQPENVNGRPGIRMEVQGQDVVIFATTATNERIRAATAAAAAAETAERDRLAAFLSQWQGRRSALESGNPNFSQVLAAVADSRSVTNTARDFERRIENGRRNQPAVQAAQTEIKTLLGTLGAINSYETELQTAARAANVDLRAAPMNALLVGHAEQRQDLRVLLSAHGDVANQHLSALTSRYIFNGETRQILGQALSKFSDEGREIVGRIENEEADPDLQAHEARLQALDTQTNRDASGSTLGAIATEINDVIVEALTHRLNVANHMRGLYQSRIDASAHVDDRDEVIRPLKENVDRYNAYLERLGQAGDQAKSIQARIEQISDRRRTASERHQNLQTPPKPTWRERLKSFVSPQSPEGKDQKTLEDETKRVVDERVARERNETPVIGTMLLNTGTPNERIELRDSGFVHYQPDENGNLVERPVTEPDEIDALLSTLNSGAAPDGSSDSLKKEEGTHFEINNQGGVSRVSDNVDTAASAKDKARAVAAVAKESIRTVRGNQKATKELRNYVRDKQIVDLVTALEGEGMDRQQIIEELAATLGGDDPSKAEAVRHGSYEAIYEEAVRQRTAEPNRLRNRLGRGAKWVVDKVKKTPDVLKSGKTQVQQKAHGAGEYFKKLDKDINKTLTWTAEHFGKYALGAAGIAAGLSTIAAAGLAYFGGKFVWNETKAIAKGAFNVGTALVATVPRVVKAPFVMIGRPIQGLGKGLKAGWEYPAKPTIKPLKGWKTPFTATGNLFRRAWHAGKALPSALGVGIFGLGAGAVKGVADSAVDIAAGSAVPWRMSWPWRLGNNSAVAGAPAPAPANNNDHNEAAGHAHAGH